MPRSLKFTGWFVLVKKNEDGRWELVGIINPDQSTEDEGAWFETVDFDLILPIPDPITVSEFRGF